MVGWGEFDPDPILFYPGQELEMPSFYGNMTGASGVPKTQTGLNVVQAFHAPQEYVADQTFLITGTTKDSTGAALANCEVELYNTITDTVIARMVSDANGLYSFFATNLQNHYAVAYKVGAPDVAGTTVNTLVGA